MSTANGSSFSVLLLTGIGNGPSIFVTITLGITFFDLVSTGFLIFSEESFSDVIWIAVDLFFLFFAFLA